MHIYVIFRYLDIIFIKNILPCNKLRSLLMKNIICKISLYMATLYLHLLNFYVGPWQVKTAMNMMKI